MASGAPFKARPLKKPNFLQRLLRRLPGENALAEINNLLADNLRAVSLEEVQEVGERYKVNLARKFPGELENFYSDYLRYCLVDKKLSAEEERDLIHLKSILSLNDKAVDRIHRETVETVYSETVEEALENGRLEENEREFLEKLQQHLKLPETVAQKIYAEKAENLLASCLQAAVEDERFSPEEESELEALARNLGIKLKYDEKTRPALDKYRLYWLIENGDIPELEVDIHLQRSEKCFFAAELDWYEYRRVTRRIRYGGPTLRIKILKGVYWRAGDLGVQAVSEDVLAHIDSGSLFLTNKRLIFLGNRKNTTIRLSRILDFNAYQNGVEIIKDSGKSPFLQFKHGVDIFSMILGRVLSDRD